jgi:type VI secretion system protein ImpA
MALREDLLKPIPGDSPSGSNLRYAPIYAQIQEARRQDDDAAPGVWQRAAKDADYPLVIKLATRTLANETKDLQIAAWLTEALTYEQGFAGLAEGLSLIGGLLENFWETVHPELEDGDAEFRATPLNWVGSCLDRPVKNTPITQAGYGWFYFKLSRGVPSEREAAADENARQRRAEAVAEGRLTPEEFDALVEATPKTYYVDLNRQLAGLLSIVGDLEQWCDQRFGDVAPSFSGLRKSLEDVHETVHVLLGHKREKEPDPEPEPAAPAAPSPVTALPAAATFAAPAALPAVFAAADPTPEPAAGAYSYAVEAARAGRLPEAVAILSRRVAEAPAGRDRFIRKTQMAEILVGAGREPVAFPTLQDLVAELDERKLEDWESPETVARTLALYYRCLVKLGGVSEESSRVYARICRLDPAQALALPG